MTEKELREIKRRFRPERSNVGRIVGCFVNGGGVVVSKISQSLGLGDSVLNEKLLGVMKRSLSGTLGTNLTDISFSTKQVLESEEHKLLMGLVKSGLSDEKLLDEFYSRVTESLKLDGNYVILLANDVYDVPSFSRDGAEGESYEQFSYIICSICPVKNMNEALTFAEADSLLRVFSPTSILSPVELGFMFPTFDERRTNIYNALYYTRSLTVNYPDFSKRIFDAEAKMPPAAQRATFSECLSEALGEECSLEVVRSVHAQVAEMVEAKKETRDPEPLVITKATVRNMLECCGVDEERIERVGEAMDESFGKNAMLSPKNIVSEKKFEIEAPDVKIKIDPEHRDLISTQTIGNTRYVMIRVEGDITVNGISIKIDE